ncbi:MAG: MATE family efflux transporter [Clostridia bacterium]|nr:MATE family efflux transporter [Clostridia bacterium]
MNKNIDMVNGGLFKKIVLFTIPIMLQGILQSLYNSADLVVVSNFAEESALPAVGATSSIYNVLLSLFLGIAAGVDVLTSFNYGRKNYENVKKTIDTAVIVAPILGIIVSIIGFFLAEPVLVLMDTPTEAGVLDGAVTYLKILMLGVPFTLLYNFCAAVFRTAGQTQKPFIYLVISGAVNVLLNLLFVAVFHLGVVGVAVATVISQILSALLILIDLLKKEGLFSFRFKKISFSWHIFGKMIAIGLPAGFQNGVFSLANSFLQAGVNSFGNDAIAASTAVSTVEGLMWVTLLSFQSTTMTFISQNLGAGKLDRVKKVFAITFMMSLVLGVILGVGTFLLQEPILKIFIKDNPAAMAYGYERLKMTFPIYFLAGIMSLLPGAIRGLGYSLPPSIISLVGACGVRIVWVYTVFEKYHTLAVLYLVHPITWIITDIALVINLIICYRKVKKRMNNIAINNKKEKLVKIK